MTKFKAFLCMRNAKPWVILVVTLLFGAVKPGKNDIVLSLDDYSAISLLPPAFYLILGYSKTKPTTW